MKKLKDLLHFRKSKEDRYEEIILKQGELIEKIIFALDYGCKNNRELDDIAKIVFDECLEKENEILDVLENNFDEDSPIRIHLSTDISCVKNFLKPF